MRKKMGHTAVPACKTPISDLIKIAKRARGKYCNLTVSRRRVNSKTGIQVSRTLIPIFRNPLNLLSISDQYVEYVDSYPAVI